jgi:organic radical activating enzyme
LNILPEAIQPCCYWEGKPEPLENIRQAMLDGKELSGCSQCYFSEKIGNKSKRQEALEKYGVVEEVSLQLLEVTFDNLCNLKCRGCCSFTSHVWRSDEVVIYGKSFTDKKYTENNLDDLDCTNLKQIDISGGEPFLSKNVENFLNRLVEEHIIENVEIGIVVSGNTRPSNNVFNALSKAKKLYLSISVDAIGELNDYFRSGSSFKTVLDNIAYLNTLHDENHKIIIHSTVSIYNVTELKKVEDFFKIHYPHFKIEHRVLQWPEHLAVQNMPADLKEQVVSIVKTFGTDYNDIIEAINLPGKDLYGHFLNFHNTLDRLRNEKLPNEFLNNYINSNQVCVDSTVFFKGQMDIL